MSSNIKVQRICEYCGNEFTARTTVTRFCSDKCAKRAYKVRFKEEKIAKSNFETQVMRNTQLEKIKAKEYLTVKDAANLLSCSVRTVYRLIDNGKISATNFSERMIRIKRSDIDSLI